MRKQLLFVLISCIAFSACSKKSDKAPAPETQSANVPQTAGPQDIDAVQQAQIPAPDSETAQQAQIPAPDSETAQQAPTPDIPPIEHDKTEQQCDTPAGCACGDVICPQNAICRNNLCYCGHTKITPQIIGFKCDSDFDNQLICDSDNCSCYGQKYKKQEICNPGICNRYSVPGPKGCMCGDNVIDVDSYTCEPGKGNTLVNVCNNFICKCGSQECHAMAVCYKNHCVDRATLKQEMDGYNIEHGLPKCTNPDGCNCGKSQCENGKYCMNGMCFRDPFTKKFDKKIYYYRFARTTDFTYDIFAQSIYYEDENKLVSEFEKALKEYDSDLSVAGSDEVKKLTIGEFLKTCGGNTIPKDVATKYCYISFIMHEGNPVLEFSGWQDDDYWQKTHHAAFDSVPDRNEDENEDSDEDENNDDTDTLVIEKCRDGNCPCGKGFCSEDSYCINKRCVCGAVPDYGYIYDGAIDSNDYGEFMCVHYEKQEGCGGMDAFDFICTKDNGCKTADGRAYPKSENLFDDPSNYGYEYDIYNSTPELHIADASDKTYDFDYAEKLREHYLKENCGNKLPETLTIRERGGGDHRTNAKPNEPECERRSACNDRGVTPEHLSEYACDIGKSIGYECGWSTFDMPIGLRCTQENGCTCGNKQCPKHALCKDGECQYDIYYQQYTCPAKPWKAQKDDEDSNIAYAKKNLSCSCNEDEDAEYDEDFCYERCYWDAHKITSNDPCKDQSLKK